MHYAMSRRGVRRALLGLTLAVSSATAWAQTATEDCGADLNGDGTISQSEIQQCTYFSASSCPSTTQACTANTTSCPTEWEACDAGNLNAEPAGVHTNAVVPERWTCPGHFKQECTIRAGYAGEWCEVSAPGCTASTTYSCPGNPSGACSADSSGQQVCSIPSSCVGGTNSGYSCPLQAKACTGSAGAGWSCPYGGQYQCLGASGQTPMCSPNSCGDPNSGSVNPTVGGGTPTSNAPVDSNNQCTGVIHIFPGRAASCMGAGVEDFWSDCCASSVTQTDTMGAKGQQSQAQENQSSQAQASLAASIAGYKCSSQDTQTGEQRASGYCVYIGDYCKENWPFVGCVQTAHSYCCFNSELARIIQQQGREQIPSMGGFGTATAPNCGGFTPEQFQSIDWSKIDMSEYYSELQYSTQSTIQSQVTTSGVPSGN